jgi:hypothetical protein
MAMLIASAAKSSVTIEGEPVEGVQSIDFSVKRRQADIEAIGSGERIGVESGQVVVNGSIRISSMNKLLDDRLYALTPESFNMVITLVKGAEQIRQITFNECYLDDKSFEMSANGVGLTVYNFTSTTVLEE